MYVYFMDFWLFSALIVFFFFSIALESCTKHVIAVDTTFANYHDLKHDEKHFRFYANATDRIQFRLNVIQDQPNTTADTFTFGEYDTQENPNCETNQYNND